MDRRKFLLGSGVAAAASLAACSDGEPDRAQGSPDGTGLAAADLDFLEFVAGVEALAVETYAATIRSASEGTLGQVPPAGSEYLQVAHDQHEQTLEKINGMLEAHQRSAVTDSNATVKDSVVEPGLTAATGFVPVAQVVRRLESGLAATYLKAVQSGLQARALIRTAAGIQATAQKRVAVLSFMLGEFPSPDPFQKTDGAFTL